MKKVYTSGRSHIASKAKPKQLRLRSPLLNLPEDPRQLRQLRIQHLKPPPLDLSEEPTLPSADFTAETAPVARGTLERYVDGWNLLKRQLRLVRVGKFTFALVGQLFLAERSTPIATPEGEQGEKGEMESGTRLIKEGDHLYAGSRMYFKVTRATDDLRASVCEERTFSHFQQLKRSFSDEVLHVISTQSWENILRHKKIIFFGMDDLAAAFPTSRIRPYTKASASYNVSHLRRVSSEAYLTAKCTRSFNKWQWVQYLESCIEAGRVRNMRRRVEDRHRPVVAAQVVAQPLQMDSGSDSDSVIGW